MKEILISLLWILVGFFITILFPPLCFSIVTWIVFPRINMTFTQIFWITSMVWLSINYITVNIEKAIEKKYKGDDK